MLYAGLDLSRKRLDFHLLDVDGATVGVGAAPPDADGLRGLSEHLARHGEPVRAAIESMNGARFVHDRLELLDWQVEIADAQKVKGLAPLARKTDRIDARVLAELARRDLVPAIWLPDPLVRAERERARWRLHLVRHRYLCALLHLARAPPSRVRRVHIEPGRLGRQQAGNLVMTLDDRGEPLRFLIHDREAKFSGGCDQVFQSEGITMIRTPVPGAERERPCRALGRQRASRVPRPAAHRQPPPPRTRAPRLHGPLQPASAAPLARISATPRQTAPDASASTTVSAAQSP
jgi:Transposase